MYLECVGVDVPRTEGVSVDVPCRNSCICTLYTKLGNRSDEAMR
jgi:hypothetical protein